MFRPSMIIRQARLRCPPGDFVPPLWRRRRFPIDLSCASPLACRHDGRTRPDPRSALRRNHPATVCRPIAVTARLRALVDDEAAIRGFSSPGSRPTTMTSRPPRRQLRRPATSRRRRPRSSWSTSACPMPTARTSSVRCGSFQRADHRAVGPSSRSRQDRGARPRRRRFRQQAVQGWRASAPLCAIA